MKDTPTPLSLRAVADRVGGRLEGPEDQVVRGVSDLAGAGPEDVSFVAVAKWLGDLAGSRAGALLVGGDLKVDRPAIRVKDTYSAIIDLIEYFHPPRTLAPGLSERAVLGENVRIGRDVTLAPYVVLEDGVEVGDGAALYPGVFVGRGSRIGPGAVVYSNVSIYWGVEIGARVIIHSGTTIGSDGYGYRPQPDGTHRKFPQVGSVVVEDEVEIGANVTIDRAALGVTRIGRGTKVDNLVHIAHNVEIGPNCLLLGQVGIAGSCSLGEGVTLGGQVGVSERVRVGDRSTVTSGGGVLEDLPGGKVYTGCPVLPHVEQGRLQVSLKRLPGLFKTVRGLLARVESLERNR